MSIPTDLPSDLIDLLAVFADSEVEYLLVGGQALALHGLPRFTMDADLWLRDTADNLSRVESALRTFGAPPAVISALPGAAALDVVWMGMPPTRIDLMKGVPGGDFERAWTTRETRSVRGTVVQLVSRDELVQLKLASGRPQDLVDAEKLQRL